MNGNGNIRCRLGFFESVATDRDIWGRIRVGFLAHRSFHRWRGRFESFLRWKKQCRRRNVLCNKITWVRAWGSQRKSCEETGAATGDTVLF